MNALLLRAPMPGRLGRVTSFATLVLLLASLPIPDDDHDVVRRPGTLEFPPREFSLHWYRAAWQTFVGCGQRQSMGAALTSLASRSRRC